MSDLHSLICDSVDDYLKFLDETTINDMLKRAPDELYTTVFNKMRDNTRNHCVMLIYYILYRDLAEKKSIRFYVGSENEAINVERSDPEYDKLLSTYKNYRTEKDKIATRFFNVSDDICLYRRFETEEKGTKVKRTSGHELSLQDYLECKFLGKYDVFTAIAKNRLADVKKISNAIFEDDIFPQISGTGKGVYQAVLEDEFVNNFNLPAVFMRSINFFAIEVNCAFEKNYLVAKTLKHLEADKDTKQREINFFLASNLYVLEGGSFQDYLICGYRELLDLYDYPKVSALFFYEMTLIFNWVLNSVSKLFFEYNDVKAEEFEITEEAEHFFENFVGRGQHVQEKSLDDFNIRDFRALYKQG